MTQYIKNLAEVIENLNNKGMVANPITLKTSLKKIKV